LGQRLFFLSTLQPSTAPATCMTKMRYKRLADRLKMELAT
jgi:hypothetical protein